MLHLATSEPERFKAMLASDVQMKPSHATRLRRFLEREGELFVVKRIQATDGATTTLGALRATANKAGVRLYEEGCAVLGDQMGTDVVCQLSDDELDGGATSKYGDEPDDDDAEIGSWRAPMAFAAGDDSDAALNAAFLFASAAAHAPKSPALGKKKRMSRGTTPAAHKKAAAKTRAAAKTSIGDAELLTGERGGDERESTTEVAGKSRKRGVEASVGGGWLVDKTSADWPHAVHSDGRSTDDELDIIDGHMIIAEAVKKPRHEPRATSPAEPPSTTLGVSADADATDAGVVHEEAMLTTAGQLKPLKPSCSPLDTAVDAPLPDDVPMPCATFGEITFGGFRFRNVEEFEAALAKVLGQLGPAEAGAIAHVHDEEELEYFREHPEKLPVMAVTAFIRNWEHARNSSLAATSLVERLSERLPVLEAVALANERVRAEKQASHAVADEIEWGAAPPECSKDEKKRRERAAATAVMRLLYESFGTMVERALPVGALATSNARDGLSSADAPTFEHIAEAFTNEYIDGHAQPDSAAPCALDFVVDSLRRLS